MSIRATFHYFQGMECDMYSFYRIPKLLFTSEYFKNLSCEAKVLYGLMLDRMSLSIKNRWFDEEDRAYIFFSVEEIMEMLNCGRNKAVNCLKELDQEKGIGLIEKRRIGLGKTNVIYVKNFSLTEYPDEPAIFDSEETPENVAERKENTETEIEEYAEKEPEKPVNTQKFEKQTSGSLKNKLQEVSKTNFKEFEKQTSRSLENKLQEVSKTNCNNTEYNYTEFSENESYQYLSEQEKGRDRIQERNEYRQLIHDNIEYEILCQSYGTGRVEELVELMLDAICSTKPYQQINGEAVPTQVVKSRLLKVGYEHIQYVFFSLDRSTSKAKNIRQYMLRFLIKLPFRIIAAPVWLVLAAVNIVLVFLVGLSAGFCYLIAGISVVTEVLSIGFGISTDWTMKSAIITTVVFVLLPHIGMGIVAVIEVVKCGLQDFIFG